jgi:RNA polymerase sigma-70 factor (ECF subfamily)
MLKELKVVPDAHDTRSSLGPPGRVPWSAFDRFVFEHQDLVYNVAYRLLGDQELAAKATEDTFTRSFPSFASFHGQAARLWLMQIVTSTCRDRLRRGPFKGMALPANGDPFQTCLGTLPLDQRITVVLSDIRGLSYHEIAQVTRAPVGTVRSRLSQGRRALRDRLLSQGKIGP